MRPVLHPGRIHRWCFGFGVFKPHAWAELTARHPILRPSEHGASGNAHVRPGGFVHAIEGLISSTLVELPLAWSFFAVGSPVLVLPDVHVSSHRASVLARANACKTAWLSVLLLRTAVWAMALHRGRPPSLCMNTDSMGICAAACSPAALGIPLPGSTPQTRILWLIWHSNSSAHTFKWNMHRRGVCRHCGVVYAVERAASTGTCCCMWDAIILPNAMPYRPARVAPCPKGPSGPVIDSCWHLTLCEGQAGQERWGLCAGIRACAVQYPTAASPCPPPATPSSPVQWPETLAL